MVTEIQLDQTPITVYTYNEVMINGLHKISVEFKVTSEDYHDVAILLYKGTFEVKVPSRSLAFTGKIIQYSTSITNLYEKGQVGDYRISLLEVQDEKEGN
ncbi:MAG: DUF3219 family protein [Bacillota bacterium]